MPVVSATGATRARTLLYASVASMLLAGLAGPARAQLAGEYAGEIRLAGARSRVAVTAALAQAGAVLSGTFTVALPGGGVSFRLAGRARRRRVRVVGVEPQGGRLRWRGHVGPNGRLRGRVRLRGSAFPFAGVMVLARSTGPGGPPTTSCGSEYFSASVMGPVMEANCARCHVPGGLAAAARLRVTRGDAAATEASALTQVDAADPTASRIVLKPLGQLGHGGGAQIAPGSVEQRALEAWVSLVVEPSCGGDGGGGHPTDGAGLWGAFCASCHGADARGTDVSPDVHCSKQILDPVRSGRGGAAGGMPAFPELTDAEVALIQGFLETLCPLDAASGAELYAGNCASCHGADAAGGGNGSGVAGPDIRCKGAGDVREKVREGDGDMPAFPELSETAIGRIADFVAGLCD